MQTVHLSYSFAALFFFTVTATPEIYTLSLHDALPIYRDGRRLRPRRRAPADRVQPRMEPVPRRSRRPGSLSRDRKSTRLNSSHVSTSYAVFCLKKKMATQ